MINPSPLARNVMRELAGTALGGRAASAVETSIAEGIGGYLLERTDLLGLMQDISPKLAARLDPALRPGAGAAGAAGAIDGAVQLGIEAGTPHQKVLIMTMGVTGGHNALAASVGRQIEQQYPGAQVVIADGSRISGDVFDSRTGELMKKFHTFERTEQPWIYDTRYRIRSTDGGTRGGRRLYDSMFRKDVKRVIDEEAPDVIVSTHPSVTATLGRMRSLGILDTPTVATLNDAAPNGLWMSPGIDEHVFYVPGDAKRLAGTFAARDGQLLHMSQARPPIEKKLVTADQVAALRTDLGLPHDKPVLVVASGSMGVPVSDATYRRMLAETDAHIVVATGSNTKMQEHLASTFPSDRLTALGFTRRMQDYIDASDGVMLKAHGMTALESVSAGKPLIFFEPEGGHARGSVRALAQDGYATLAGDDSDLTRAIRELSVPASKTRMTAQAASTWFDAPRSYADVIMHARPRPAVAPPGM
ncbi:MAG: hypothetical protein KDC46_08465 [Thermoleophilia bacterium]|nr:hypothetical protein [Thermoleophilia bacterium]